MNAPTSAPIGQSGPPRLGKKKTIVAVEPSILIAVWHTLTDNIDDQDRGCDFFTERATFS